jgi:hypothetical protein
MNIFAILWLLINENFIFNKLRPEGLKWNQWMIIFKNLSQNLMG